MTIPVRKWAASLKIWDIKWSWYLHPLKLEDATTEFHKAVEAKNVPQTIDEFISEIPIGPVKIPREREIQL